MVFDLPKAIHFTASKDGVRLDDFSVVGLAWRWTVAHRCRDAGVNDMRNLSIDDRLAVGTACSKFNDNKSGIVVQLALTEEQQESH